MTLEMEVQFPNLFGGTTINYFRGFNLFGLTIYFYGVIIAVGLVLAVLYAMHRATKDFGLVKDRAFDVIFAATIGGFLCARIYYCVFSETKYTIITMFTTIRDGGIAIYGGIIGAFVIGFVFCKIRKVNFFAMADMAALGFLIGQCIGRWGNFVNQEAYGEICDSKFLFAMTGSRIAEEMGRNAVVHPCFLYESVWCLLGFVFLHFYSKKLRSFDGEIVLLYAAWYGFGRMFIEGIRTDSLYWGSFRVSQALAAVSCAAALITFVICKIVTKKKGTVLYVNSDASRELIESDLKAEELKKAKKSKKAPSILGDEDAEESGETAIENTNETTVEDTGETTAETGETAAEEAAENNKEEL